MAFGYVRGVETSRHLTAIAESEFPAALESQAGLTHFRELISSYADAVTLGEVDAIAEAEISSASARRAIALLEQYLQGDAPRRAQIVALGARLEDFTRAATPVYERLALGHDSEELEERAAELAERYTALGGDLEAFGASLDASVKDGLHATSFSNEQLWKTNLLIFMAVVLGAVSLVSMIIHRSITAPLRKTADFARTMAAGDLSQKLDIDQRDEIGALAQAINVMAAEIERSQGSLEAQVAERTAQLKSTHEELMVTARKAGMAEVASAVLHNVGNVLNSVNVTAESLRARVRESKVENLGRTCRLLEEHAESLAGFLRDDPKGSKVVPYLGGLALHLCKERDKQLEMLEALHDHVAHITAIISRQQSNSRSGDLTEELEVQRLVDEAVALSSSGDQRDGVVLELALPRDLPPILADRHKTLQILVNLLKNARQACDEGGAPDKIVRVEAARDDHGRLAIQVRDSGVGISPENMRKLFTHGFTTKQHGHGFGLHSACLAAREMGGELSAASPGEGQGATFTLDLPTTIREARDA